MVGGTSSKDSQKKLTSKLGYASDVNVFVNLFSTKVVWATANKLANVWSIQYLFRTLLDEAENYTEEANSESKP